MESCESALVGRQRPAAVRYPLTVFYDASCPLCASEMHQLKGLDRDVRLELVDCSAPEFDESVLAGVGIRRSDLMRILHARDACGRWLMALDAIEAAYRAVGLERTANVCGSRRLRPLLDPLYRWIAARRQALSRVGGGSLVSWLIDMTARIRRRVA
jgi:predicted DCC family thiol-disulfide oxidoreductase YuxK